MKKIVFFLILILLFLYKTQNVFAYQDAFTVDKIIIEGKIKQNNYKDRYIDIAFRKGFEKLLSNILKIEEVSNVDLKLVWNPPWTQDMMSEAAKLELNL